MMSAMPLIKAGIRQFTRLLFRLCFRVRVRGSVGKHERLLLVSNHQSLLDGVLLGAFLPVEPMWVLHTSIARHWWVRLPMSFLPHLVIDSANPLAMKRVIELLEGGTPVLIFPEGRVTTTGSMMKLYEGPAYAAARTGAAVVPIHIEGAVYSYFSRMTGDFPKKLFPRITVTIHEPRWITRPDLPTARSRRKVETEQLRRIMQQSAFDAREKGTLFPALLDAIKLHGRRRRMLEDSVHPYHEATYGGILKGSLALGRMVSKVTGEGERVGVLMPNTAATVSLILGMFAFRRVPAMLNYSSGAEALRHACRTAGVKLIITSRSFLEKARIADNVSTLDGVSVVCLEDLRAGFGAADKLWLLFFALRFPRLVARPARPEDPAVILFTSGTEGRPKGVVLSHDALLANVAQIRAIIEFSSKDRFMSALPLFHAFGLTVGVLLPLLYGTRIFLHLSPLHYRVVPELIYDRDCTVLFSSSTFLGNYARYAHPFDFSRLRLVVAGAEKLSDEVRRLYADKFGIRILEGYGVTETAPVVSVNTPLAARTGSVGQPAPGCELRIEKVPGIECGGLLHIRGANVMIGYLDENGRIDPVHSIFGPGWHNTGDIASIDEAGFLYIHGRLKRFAKVAGEMVPLELTERIAAAASPDRTHAAVAIAEEGRGESIVLLTDDPALRRERLQQAARDLGVPELAIPRRLISVREVPHLPNGKRDYPAIDRMARELIRERALSS
jgi:acyl-[acyl-carrier-protein]-phospholipid O-acyltransferase/long-chain-fatty-acid--[acyl-carrier-protein] ligase